jgi:hypothetical protein
MVRRIGVIAVVAIAAMGGQAAAGLLPAYMGMTPEGDNYRYTYSVQLQSGSVLKSGDYFTIFDFAGMVGGTNTQPAGFKFSTVVTGPTPEFVNPADDAMTANATWTYTGSETIGPSELGEFSLVSRYDMTNNDSFAAQTHRQDGLPNGNVTDTNVPVPTCYQHVPEPSTLIMVIAGVPLALGLRRMRRRMLA